MRVRLGLGAALCGLVCALLLAACTDDEVAPGPGPATLPWQELTLPAAPPGTRSVLAGAAVCDGHWYLVGGYDGAGDAADEQLLGSDDTTDPATWTSVDGKTWTTLPVAAHSYYGIRSLLWSVACRSDGSVVALGGKVGGAHGNPRMASYFPVPAADGTTALTEIDASFELYGGPKAINVGQVRAGSTGYLIVGNRSAGAAVWLSPTGEQFELIEGAPVLASQPQHSTWAADAAFHDGEWVLVGGLTTADGRDPAAWRSPDGRTWTELPAQGAADHDEFTAVTAVAGSLTAVGIHADTFQAWRLDAGQWRAGTRFGSTRVEPREGRLAAAMPISLTAAGNQLFALVKAGWVYELWTSLDAGGAWQLVAPPIDLPATDDGRAALVATPGGVLLVADDGEQAHAYLAPVSTAE